MKYRNNNKNWARHPKGFLLFLSSEEIIASDEYQYKDPYSVEENIESEFHTRRIELTLNLVQEAANKIQGKAKILDLGCGKGFITASIQKALGEAEITGLDYSLAAIEYANDHFPGIDFSVGNAYELPYVESYFDIIVCNNLWEHVPDPSTLLEKVSYVLKPGGYFLVSTPSRYRLQNLGRVLLGKPVVFMSQQHVTEYSVGQVIELLVYGKYRVLRVLSSPIKHNNIKLRLAYVFFKFLIKLVNSQHRLESTVFYLAQKNEQI